MNKEAIRFDDIKRQYNKVYSDGRLVRLALKQGRNITHLTFKEMMDQ